VEWCLPLHAQRPDTRFNKVPIMSQTATEIHSAVSLHPQIAVGSKEAKSIVMFPSQIRIVIASSQGLLREGIRELLRIREEIEVLADAADVTGGIEIAVAICPDILLADVSLNNFGELRKIREATAGLLPTRVLLLTDTDSEPEVSRLFAAGVSGILLRRSVTAKVLVTAISAVMAGERRLGEEWPTALAKRPKAFGSPTKPHLPYSLTPREMEILMVVMRGYTNGQIAQELLISIQTVKHHISNIFDKTGVDTRLELALFAHHHHLLETAGLGQEPGVRSQFARQRDIA
jgi:two-component system nitrate/nitrite response regulator NarL